jgi:NAD(P)-dependent dehydrogenase (short-subunit alcohol dehydrogenase family)
VSGKSALDLFRLDGKIALVTGGTGIVGAPISTALAEAGATVIIASRNAEQCRTFAASLTQQGLKAEGERLDLGSEEEIRGLRDRILKRHSRLDVLFNNAVARAGGDLRHTNAEEWDEVMRVNSTGVFLASQIFSEPMQAQRSGSIINISSIYGVVGPDFSIYESTTYSNPVNYSFAKAGIIGLTRYLASFLGPFGVRVNCLSPGGVWTADTPEKFVGNYSRRTFLGRMARPEDIKGPAVFLASDASAYVTGQNIPVDAGWTAM